MFGRGERRGHYPILLHGIRIRIGRWLAPSGNPLENNTIF